MKQKIHKLLFIICFLSCHPWLQFKNCHISLPGVSGLKYFQILLPVSEILGLGWLLTLRMRHCASFKVQVKTLPLKLFLRMLLIFGIQCILKLLLLMITLLPLSLFSLSPLVKEAHYTNKYCWVEGHNQMNSYCIFSLELRFSKYCFRGKSIGINRKCSSVKNRLRWGVWNNTVCKKKTFKHHIFLLLGTEKDKL